MAESNHEFNSIRQELSIVDSKNYSERKEIERLEHELREANAVSHKNYQEIQRLREIGVSRDTDNKNSRARID